MEVITREGASIVTQEFILDEFMGGFLYTLFREKWAEFKLWIIHIVLSSLDGLVVAMVGYVALEIKRESKGQKEQHTACMVVDA